MMNVYIKKAETMIHEAYTSNRAYSSYLCNKYKGYKYLCIFGAGNVGRPTANEMISHSIRVDYFCDNDIEKHGTIIDGLPCISVSDLCNIKDDTMVIICGRAFDEIYKQLRDLEFPYIDRLHVNKFRIREYMNSISETYLFNQWCSLISLCEDDQSRETCLQILAEWCSNESRSLNRICTPNQYFCQDILGMGNHEVIVDGGAYIGDTLEQFLNVYGDFDKYYMFEISKSNFIKMKSYVSILDSKYRDKIVCINSGLSSRAGKIFYKDDDEGAKLDDCAEGNIEGSITSIDEVCKEIPITYIKMDIEGSELDALKGAEQCIRNNHPKLAICLYHKPKDMWEIPNYIKSIGPDYKIYIRHHTDLMNETVCYAI